MSTVREMWAAASTLMDYWNRLSDDRGETVPEPEYSKRLAGFPERTKTDMELVVDGFRRLKVALATFDPDKWADEAKTQAFVAWYAERLKQETERADRAEARLKEAT